MLKSYIECSKQHPFPSTSKSKWLSCSRMKWWAKFTNLQLNPIVSPPHPQSGDSLNQDAFLASSGNFQIQSYAKEYSNHHRSKSTPMPNRLSCSKVKWWAIYTNLVVTTIVTITPPHPRSRDSLFQEKFFARFPDNKSWNYDTKSLNHSRSQSIPRSQGSSCSKMKWRPLYTYLPVNAIVRPPHQRPKMARTSRVIPQLPRRVLEPPSLPIDTKTKWIDVAKWWSELNIQTYQ